MVDDILRAAFAAGAFAVMLLTHLFGLHDHDSCAGLQAG